MFFPLFQIYRITNFYLNVASSKLEDSFLILVYMIAELPEIHFYYQESYSCSCSRLSLPGRGHVLVRCSHSDTGLRPLFLVLQFLDFVWNALVPFTPYMSYTTLLH